MVGRAPVEPVSSRQPGETRSTCTCNGYIHCSSEMAMRASVY